MSARFQCANLGMLVLCVLVGGTRLAQAAPVAKGPLAPMLVLKGHAKGIFNVTYSPDGKQLASCSGDKEVRLWDAKTGKELRVLKGHTGSVYTCTFAPDGKLLASASDDKSIRLWDPATGKAIHRLTGHTGSVYNVVFSPDGKLLASGSYDHTVILWNVASGERVRTLKGHADRVIGVSFGPEGNWLVTSSTANSSNPQNEVWLWDVQSGELLAQVPDTAQGVVTASFSPDGKRIVGTCRSKGIVVWESVTGLETLLLKGHTQQLHQAVFSPNGRRLATCSGSYTNDKPGEVKIWDLPTGKDVRTLKGFSFPVWSLSFHPNGKQLAVALGSWSKTKPGEVHLYDLSDLPADNRPVGGAMDAQLQEWWDDLDRNEGRVVYEAIWKLSAASRKSLPFLLAKLEPPSSATREEIDQLLRQLENDEFEIREKASEALSLLGAVARPALLQAKESPDPEVRRRVRSLLNSQTAGLGLSREEVRCIRAIEALEHMEGEDVRPALNKLTKGPPASPVVLQAKAALRRLETKRQ